MVTLEHTLMWHSEVWMHDGDCRLFTVKSTRWSRGEPRNAKVSTLNSSLWLALPMRMTKPQTPSSRASWTTETVTVRQLVNFIQKGATRMSFFWTKSQLSDFLFVSFFCCFECAIVLLLLLVQAVSAFPWQWQCRYLGSHKWCKLWQAAGVVIVP